MRTSAPVVMTALLLWAMVDSSAQQGGCELEAFVGTWRASTTSRELTSSSATYTFQPDVDGYVMIERGGVQLRDRVRFDGKDYPTPGIADRKVSSTKVSDTVYETTIKRDGALVAKNRWVISEGGKRLTQETTPARIDDKQVTNVTEYARISGEGNLLIGVWKPASFEAGEQDLFVITVIDGPALSMFYPRNGDRSTIRPDGKWYAPTGRNVWPDVTTSAEALGRWSLRRTTVRAGTPIRETVMTVSPDGRTLTVTSRRPGSSDLPAIFTYEKQR